MKIMIEAAKKGSRVTIPASAGGAESRLMERTASTQCVSSKEAAKAATAISRRTVMLRW